MPMFELDAGRPAPIQPMQPAAGTFDTDSSSVVREHLGSLLGEPLFPVARREPGSPDAPHLLAVDAAGQPVVVEVVQVLDAAALTRSLRLAGAAARMSSVDLARAYAAGPDEFAADLVAFRETVPVSTAHAAARHGGARLLLVCSEVAESVVDAVEFLRGPDRRVDVLQLGVVRGSDGRRFVEVSSLVADVPTRRPVEPSPVRVVTSGAAGGGSGDVGPQPSAAREQLAGATAPLGTFPSVLPVPVGGGVAEPRAADDGVRPARDETPTGPVEVVPVPEPAADVAAEPVGSPTDEVADDGAVPTDVDDDDAAVVDVVEPEEAVEPEAAAAEPGVEADEDESDAAHSGETAPPADAEPTGDDADAEPEADAEAEAQADEGAQADGSAAPDGVADAAEPAPDPTLVALAERLGGTTTLVWTRLRRGQRFVAMLRRDGLLQLSDGTVHADPDAAATAVADAESTVDGWRAWHVGDGGPSLAEARES